MVKKLYIYNGKPHDFAYAYSNEKFRSSIVAVKDQKGNYKYSIQTPQGEVPVYSKGKRKIKMLDGMFILEIPMKGSEWVAIMDEKDKEMAKLL